jgi:hypothetical protein
VLRPPLALGPLTRLQSAVDITAFSILNIAADADTTPVRIQLRLTLYEGGFGLNATGVIPDSNAVDFWRSRSQHTASFLAAVAYCHDALPEAHSSLRPFSQLHYAPTTPCAAPGPSLCASLWRSLSHSHPLLHPAERLALPPDPSLIPVSAGQCHPAGPGCASHPFART